MNEMEWKKIHITLPREIKQLYEGIYLIHKNSCIAGGFLSDLYMRTPYQDVDIFLKKHPEKEKAIHQYMLEKGYDYVKRDASKSSHYPSTFLTKTYQKGKWIVQLIFTDKGINQVKYFDFRFREFFYLNQSCYASIEALQDIQNKRLVVGVSNYFLKTYYRTFEFAKRYQFTIDKTSLNRLIYLFNYYSYDLKQFKHFFSKRNTPIAQIVKTHLEQFYQPKQDSFLLPQSEMYEDIPVEVLHKIKSYPVPRDLFERVFTPPKPFTPIHVPFELNGTNVVTLQRQKATKDLLQLWKAQRIRLLTVGESGLFQKVIQFYELFAQDVDFKEALVQSGVAEIKNRSLEFHNSIHRYDFLVQYNRLFSKLYRFEEQAGSYGKSNDIVTISKNFKYIGITKTRDMKDYINGHFMLIEFPVIGYVSYNLRTKKIHQNESITPVLFKEYLQQVLQKPSLT